MRTKIDNAFITGPDIPGQADIQAQQNPEVNLTTQPSQPQYNRNVSLMDQDFNVGDQQQMGQSDPITVVNENPVSFTANQEKANDDVPAVSFENAKSFYITSSNEVVADETTPPVTPRVGNELNTLPFGNENRLKEQQNQFSAQPYSPVTPPAPAPPDMIPRPITPQLPPRDLPVQMPQTPQQNDTAKAFILESNNAANLSRMEPSKTRVIETPRFETTVANNVQQKPQLNIPLPTLPLSTFQNDSDEIATPRTERVTDAPIVSTLNAVPKDTDATITKDILKTDSSDKLRQNLEKVKSQLLSEMKPSEVTIPPREVETKQREKELDNTINTSNFAKLMKNYNAVEKQPSVSSQPKVAGQDFDITSWISRRNKSMLSHRSFWFNIQVKRG